MLCKVFWGLAWLHAMSCVAFAQVNVHTDYPDIPPPLYPEILIEADDSLSGDADLTALRAAIVRASKALVKLPDGAQVYDPEAMLPLLADEVELFVGVKRASLQEDFSFVGRQPKREALGIVGGLIREPGSPDPTVRMRYGMHVLARLGAEPTVGASAWLGGRICTSAYGKLDPSDWRSLREKMPTFQRDDWRIAVVINPEAGDIFVEGWPKRYQMVPVSDRQKRSGGSIGIVSPDGATIFFEDWFDPAEGHFAPYLNDHLCFRKEDGEWKISAVAIRLD